jgi:hypothetical protein
MIRRRHEEGDQGITRRRETLAKIAESKGLFRSQRQWHELGQPGDRPASRQVECVFDFPWFLGHAQEHAP